MKQEDKDKIIEQVKDFDKDKQVEIIKSINKASKILRRACRKCRLKMLTTPNLPLEDYCPICRKMAENIYND